MMGCENEQGCEVSNRLRFKNYFFRENRKGEKCAIKDGSVD